ncbi:MAG: class I SAM-dependent RNA methyltransferase [Ruminococcus sp.]|nr:class I SAM-dependent RNA methyltransferase [Ruminococcus sp.]
MTEKIKFAAPCIFGLESTLGFELKRMGAENVSVTDGRVTFEGGFDTLARANLRLSTAERVLIELGSFKAESFAELFDGVMTLPLESFIGRLDAFPVKGHSIDSKLHSIPDCQSIIKKAAVDRLKKTYHIEHFEETGAVHQITFNIFKDIATIYLDTSGAGLHKRGYRKNSNAAPIKETLAAGIIDLAKVRLFDKMYDPMCGSGTFLIESVYKALGVAPGLRRSFAAEKWEQLSPSVWQEERAAAMELIDKTKPFKAYGFDIDTLAVDLTIDNAKKAGVGSKILVSEQDIKDFKPQRGAVTVCNPPYGERLLDLRQAEELYKVLGDKLSPDKDSPCYIITPHEEFEKFFGKKADKKRKLYNGMIKCNLYMYFK